MWFVALCRLQEQSIWVSKCWCRCNSHVLLCSGVYAGLFCSDEQFSFFTARLPVTHQRSTNNEFLPA